MVRGAAACALGASWAFEKTAHAAIAVSSTTRDSNCRPQMRGRHMRIEFYLDRCPGRKYAALWGLVKIAQQVSTHLDTNRVLEARERQSPDWRLANRQSGDWRSRATSLEFFAHPESFSRRTNIKIG
jgi:hypothetical protein